ncbi:hypothetical protein Dsin_032328 [Dipteronia sinensis]|uniref:Transmembrane protein n=1 Tax=Dipteronia sinensis TaxID=43782 RepID=A0AAE0DT88_9ROSI|nr:hypothetical protein Dsin_032328 [Dipteronia sinensis]
MGNCLDIIYDSLRLCGYVGVDVDWSVDVCGGIRDTASIPRCSNGSGGEIICDNRLVHRGCSTVHADCVVGVSKFVEANLYVNKKMHVIVEVMDLLVFLILCLTVYFHVTTTLRDVSLSSNGGNVGSDNRGTGDINTRDVPRSSICLNDGKDNGGAGGTSNGLASSSDNVIISSSI